MNALTLECVCARPRWTALLPLLVTLGSSTTFAQSTPPTEAALAARRTLVERAQDASRAGHHDEALSQAESAGRIEMTPSLRMFIAQERATLGQYALAMEAADQCVREATRSAALERREMILTSCRQITHNNQSHVVLLTITSPPQLAAGTVVRLGSRTFEPSSLGTPINIDATPMVFTVSAPGVEPFREERTLVEGTTVTVVIPQRFAQSIATTTATTTTNSAPVLTAQTTPQQRVIVPVRVARPRTDPGAGRRVAGLVLGAVSVGAFTTSVLTWWIREGTVAAYNADPNCPGTAVQQPPGQCSERASSAGFMAGLSLGSAIGGGVLLATGGSCLPSG